MNNFIFSSVLIVCLIFGNLFANNSDQIIQTFYKNPGFTQLVEATGHISSYLSQTKDRKDREHLLNIATIFVGQAIKEHPNYLKELNQGFSSLTFYEKAVLLRGIRSADIGHDLLKNISDKKLKQIVFSTRLKKVSEIKNLPVREPGDLDLIWGSYFATGDSDYIKKIIRVINHDKMALFHGYELINREHNAAFLSELTGKRISPDKGDLNFAINVKRLWKPGYKNRVLVVKSALWSLEANCNQDPEVRRIRDEVIMNNPELDYWKRIDKIING